MAEVVHALEGSLIPMQCFDELGGSRVLCNHVEDGFKNCATKLLWTRVQGGVERVLEQTTLAELAQFADRGAEPSVPRPTPARRRSGTARTRQLQPTGKRVNARS
jgi:DNA-binding IscR family transcriptional regulator